MFSKLNQNKFLQSSNLELEDAPDKPPTLFISVIVVISFLFVFVIISLAYPVTARLAEFREDKTNTGMGNTERIVYLSGQKQILSSYKKIDDQHYQVPIQQAITMVVARQGHMPSNSNDK